MESTPNPQTPDTPATHHPVHGEIVQSFLSMLFVPGDRVEFRAIKADRGIGHSAYRVADSDFTQIVSGMAEWLEAHNQGSYDGIYIGVNPRGQTTGGSGGSGTDADVVCFRSLFVDFDDATIDEAIRRITAAGLPSPTFLVASGRATGTHAYWRLASPVENSSVWKGLQRTLISVLQTDPTIHNPSRIMRLPGTFNHKRGAECRLLISGEPTQFNTWQSIGISPTFEPEPPTLPYDPDRKFSTLNLNTATLYFLANKIPEGGIGTRFSGRNSALMAAAMDYRANNAKIEDAYKELGDQRAIHRDGMSQAEAYRTIRNAYKRNPVPSFVRTVLSDWGTTPHQINSKTGMIRPCDYSVPESFQIEADMAAKEQIAAGSPLPESVVAIQIERQSTPAENASGILIPAAKDEREDRRPVDVRDRPTVANVDVNYVLEGNKRKRVMIYKTPQKIFFDIQQALNGWPRRANSVGLFAMKETTRGKHEIWPLMTPVDLFALLHDRANVKWVNGECEAPDGSVLTAVSKSEMFEWLKSNCTPNYETVSEYPHVPPRPNVCYLPIDLPPATGHRLQELLDELNPETELDRHLLLATMMTPGWGGPPGARPIFVISSDYGQGAGKTETAKAIGRIWGGAAPLDYEDSWQNICKRIMSSDDWLSRVYLFDNVKGKFGGAAIEAAVTSERISGHKMYVGTVQRPNDATFIITFNLQELSRDIAQRSIIIKLGRPSTKNFVEWANSFIAEHRLQLLADIYALLKAGQLRTSNPILYENRDRWQAWQSSVLASAPDMDVNLLAREIIDRRPGADADADESADICRAIQSYLENAQRFRQPDPVAVITAAELVKVLETTGNWTSNNQFSPAANHRRCIHQVRQKLIGRSVIRPALMRTSGGRETQRKVCVNDLGQPVPHFPNGTRSAVFLWDSIKAREAIGDAQTDQATFQTQSGEDMPPL